MGDSRIRDDLAERWQKIRLHESMANVLMRKGKAPR